MRLRASGGTRTIVPSDSLTVPSPTTSPVEQVRDAEEAGDERGPRLLVELARRAELLDPAAVHDHDPVGHGHGLFLVVRDVDEGDADLVLDALQLELHLLAQLEVERAERLVEEQHPRTVDERARERDPLLLAARELARLALLEPAEPDELERLATRASAARRPRTLLAAQPEGDVLEDREVREERVRLEHGVDVALVRRQRRRRRRRRARCGPRSAPRSRRSCAASSSCRSPDGPSSAKKRPRSMSSEMSSTATTSSKRFVSPISRMSARP